MRYTHSAVVIDNARARLLASGEPRKRARFDVSGDGNLDISEMVPLMVEVRKD